MKVVKKEEIYSGFLKFDNLTIKLNNGEEIQREIITKRDGVAIVAIDNKTTKNRINGRRSDRGTCRYS